jgi:hypothetical protein
VSAMADTVFRKTPQGQAELAQRRGDLPPRMRSVLVMVNGIDAAARLMERLGGDVLATLEALLQRGLIEPAAAAAKAGAAAAPRPRAAVASPPAAQPPGASPAPATAPAGADEAQQRMRLATRQLIQILLPHFGPDAPRIAQGAVAATTPAEFNQALEAVSARLAIHMGRKRAAEVLAPLRQIV